MNLKAGLQADEPPLSFDDAVSRRMYLVDMKNFTKVDTAWANHFTEPFPVSTCVQI